MRQQPESGLWQWALHPAAVVYKAAEAQRAGGSPGIRNVGCGRNLAAEHAAGNGVETHPQAGSGDVSYYGGRSLASET